MSGVVSRAATGASTDPGRAAAGLKASFDEVYAQADPRPYFRVLGDLGYAEAAHMARIAWGLLRQRGRGLDDGRVQTVLDLCCSYGMLGALLGTDASLGDLAARYRDPAIATWSSQRVIDEDREYLARHRRPGTPIVHGVDAAAPAVAYARAIGAIVAGFAEDLEDEEPSEGLRRVIASVDLVTVAGGIGYVTERTLDRVLRHAPAPGPWIAALVSRTYPYDHIATTLAGHGLVTERLTTRTFPRRRFASAAEQQAVLSHLRGLRIDATGREDDGWYHADLFVSRPRAEARPSIDRVLERL